jgi:hypothetical protein
VDDVVMLFGGTTLPSARERGAQRALIDARLDAAARQGATLAISVAAPGSGSERNLRRAGFTCAYTAALYERPADRRTSA